MAPKQFIGGKTPEELAATAKRRKRLKRSRRVVNAAGVPSSWKPGKNWEALERRAARELELNRRRLG